MGRPALAFRPPVQRRSHESLERILDAAESLIRERGFDVFRIPRPVPLLPDETRHLLRRNLRRGLSFAVDTAQFDRLYSLGEDIDATLFSALEQRTKPGAPLFVFLNYMDAHFPYVPPAPYNASFPGKRPRWPRCCSRCGAIT